MNIKKDIEFREKYEKIIQTMGFSEGDDLKSRDILDNIIKQKDKYSLDQQLENIRVNILKNKKILIFGGGPDSEEFLNLLKKDPKFSLNDLNALIIAIDGATELLQQHMIIPQIIFTDLDGIQNNTVMENNYDESFFIIHAHGDNMDKINIFKDFIMNCEKVIGTTQVESTNYIINHGGFTDGDRALYFINNFTQKDHRIFLIGYDFGLIAGKFSKPKFHKNQRIGEIKKKKLDIGIELTKEICSEFPCFINFVEINYEINSNIFNHEHSSNMKKIKLNNRTNLKKVFI
ncbi:MAG: DUF115 domain-containing protein [archaeon]|nr:DUF115 domain-containing protein [archaeon]